MNLISFLYIVALPLASVIAALADIHSIRPFLMPTILKDIPYPKVKYRQTAASYFLWAMWLVAIMVAIAQYLEKTGMDDIGPIHGLIFFVLPMLVIIIFCIAIYYLYEGFFMKTMEGRPKLESVFYFEKNLLGFYSKKLRLYLSVNLLNVLTLVAFASIYYLVGIPSKFDALSIFINVSSLISYFLTLGRLRTYVTKLAGALGHDPHAYFHSTWGNPAGLFMVYVHGISLLLQSRPQNVAS